MKTSSELLIDLVVQLQKENEELRHELNILKGYTQIIPNQIAPFPSYSNICHKCGMTIYGNNQYHKCDIMGGYVKNSDNTF